MRLADISWNPASLSKTGDVSGHDVGLDTFLPYGVRSRLFREQPSDGHCSSDMHSSSAVHDFARHSQPGWCPSSGLCRLSHPVGVRPAGLVGRIRCAPRPLAPSASPTKEGAILMGTIDDCPLWAHIRLARCRPARGGCTTREGVLRVDTSEDFTLWVSSRFRHFPEVLIGGALARLNPSTFWRCTSDVHGIARHRKPFA